MMTTPIWGAGSHCCPGHRALKEITKRIALLRYCEPHVRQKAIFGEQESEASTHPCEWVSSHHSTATVRLTQSVEME